LAFPFSNRLAFLLPKEARSTDECCKSKEQNMTQKTVAEILVETLVVAGVTRIYGVVGDSLNGVRYGFPLYPVLS
jgi:hypothetical protein